MMDERSRGANEPLNLPKDRAKQLERAFAAEDGCVSVGGLAHRFGMLRGAMPGPGASQVPEVGKAPDFDARRLALAKFVELSRRGWCMTVEQFANAVGVDPEEILQAEDEDALSPEPRVVFALAKSLAADAGKLMELAGHVVAKDEAFDREAIRFAAWSRGSEPLSTDEQRILSEFAKVVVQRTDRS